jgi:hypothetical protein
METNFIMRRGKHDRSGRIQGRGQECILGVLILSIRDVFDLYFGLESGEYRLGMHEYMFRTNPQKEADVPCCNSKLGFS